MPYPAGRVGEPPRALVGDGTQSNEDGEAQQKPGDQAAPDGESQAARAPGAAEARRSQQCEGGTAVQGDRLHGGHAGQDALERRHVKQPGEHYEGTDHGGQGTDHPLHGFRADSRHYHRLSSYIIGLSFISSTHFS